MDKNTTTPLIDPVEVLARIRRNAAMKEDEKHLKEAEARQKVKDCIRKVLDCPNVVLPVVVHGYGGVGEMNKILDELIRKPHPFVCEWYPGGQYRIVQVNNEFLKEDNLKRCLFVINAVLITFVSIMLYIVGQGLLAVVIIIWFVTKQ